MRTWTAAVRVTVGAESSGAQAIIRRCSCSDRASLRDRTRCPSRAAYPRGKEGMRRRFFHARFPLTPEAFCTKEEDDMSGNEQHPAGDHPRRPPPGLQGRDRGAAARQPCARAAEKKSSRITTSATSPRRSSCCAGTSAAGSMPCSTRRRWPVCSNTPRTICPPISRSWASAKSSRSCRCSIRRPRRTTSKGARTRAAQRARRPHGRRCQARPVVSELVRRGRDRQPHDHRLCQHPCRHDRASGDEGADPAGRRHRQHLHALRRRRKRRARRRDRPQGADHRARNHRTRRHSHDVPTPMSTRTS